MPGNRNGWGKRRRSSRRIGRKYKNERDLMKGRNDSEASNEQANEEVKLSLAPSDLDAVIVDQQETVKN